MSRAARVVSGILASGWLLGAAAPEPEAPPEPAPAAERAEPVLRLSGMTYVSSRGDANEIVLDAAHARFLPERETALLDDVHFLLDAPAGEGSVDMTCDSGTFRLGSGDFVAEGDVRGVTGDGRRFRTARLVYRHGEGVVSTDHPVEIRDETGTYRGGGFRYHVSENRFRLLGGATVVQDR